MPIKITGGSSGLHCHCGNDNGNTDAACVMHLLEVRQTLVMQRRFKIQGGYREVIWDFFCASKGISHSGLFTPQ